jgi:hypothetical protein
MAVGSVGCRAALANRQLTPELISLSSGTARLPQSISSLTNFLELARRNPTKLRQPTSSPYSHSIVPGGLLVTS